MKVEMKQIEGYAYGAIQPSIILTFSDYSAGAENLCKKLQKPFEYLPRFDDPQRFSDSEGPIGSASAPAIFVTLLDTLNSYCGDQRFTPIRVFEEGASLCFALPTLSTAMGRSNTHVLNALVDMVGQSSSSSKVQRFLKEHKGKARPFLPGGTNAGNFIAAAAERKIPFKIFSLRHVIFGYGSGSRIFNSSLTDQESVIGVHLAKSKVETNRLLKMSGIPVAEQASVRTLEDALSFSEKIGYPVVLKPEAEEQGRGIFANIKNKNDLEDCFNFLVKKYSHLLLERHIIGDHYRIDLMDGKVIKAVLRRAASVVGDGSSTIQVLIQKLNLDPERLDQNSSKGLVAIDQDLHRCLKNQDLKITDVLERDRCVYLKSISNLSRGGDQVHVESTVHPENYELCSVIARTFRLKICGIDILSPDLSQPWYTNGAAICEVNSQPQLGKSKTEVYWIVLSNYIEKQPEIVLSICNVPAKKQVTLFDTKNVSLKITATPSDVLSNGCPVQYFDELKISDDVSDEDRQKIERMLVSVQPQLDETVA
jgi:D-alanine-D-alanine ligase-like ATP-grasp enzyme